MPRSAPTIWRLAAVLVSFLCTPAGASTILEVDTEALAVRSERVVVATVREQLVVSHDSPGGAYVETRTTLQVESTLVGPTSPERVELIQTGGEARVGGRLVRSHVLGAARFVAGQRVVVFLERRPSGDLVVAGMAQGLREVVSTPAGLMVVPAVTSELELVSPRAGGVNALRTPAEEPLEELVVRIRAAAARRVTTPQVRVRR
jgi:hypothetical protein